MCLMCFKYIVAKLKKSTKYHFNLGICTTFQGNYSSKPSLGTPPLDKSPTSAAWPQSPLSSKKKTMKLKKKIKASKDIECCLNCAPGCLQGFKCKFSQIFWGVPFWTTSPDLFPALSQFGLCPQFSGTLRHRFRLCPQFSPSEIFTWLRL